MASSPKKRAAKKPGHRQAALVRSPPAAGLRDYLEQIVDQANVLVIATDLAGRTIVWN